MCALLLWLLIWMVCSLDNINHSGMCICVTHSNLTLVICFTVLTQSMLEIRNSLLKGDTSMGFYCMYQYCQYVTFGLMKYICITLQYTQRYTGNQVINIDRVLFFQQIIHQVLFTKLWILKIYPSAPSHLKCTCPLGQYL